MDNHLIRQVSQNAPVSSRDRAVVREARKRYEEVQLANFMAAGAFALGGEIMKEAAELDNFRLRLANGDPLTAAMLADFEFITLQQAKHIQRGLFNDYEF